MDSLPDIADAWEKASDDMHVARRKKRGAQAVLFFFANGKIRGMDATDAEKVA
jgi:hypothetical protein